MLSVIKGLWKRIFRLKDYFEEKGNTLADRIRKARIETFFHLKMCRKFVCKEKLHSSQMKELVYFYHCIPKHLKEYEALLSIYIQAEMTPSQAPIISTLGSSMMSIDPDFKAKRIDRILI